MKRRQDYLQLRRQFHELEERMHQGDEQYDALCRRLVEVDRPHEEITKTMFWHWFVERSDFPEQFFYATPPLEKASESDRILVTGTKVEVRDIDTILKGWDAYQRVVDGIGRRRKKLLSGDIHATLVEEPSCELVVATRSLVSYECQPTYVFAARVASFWEQFFGEENFLDCLDKISVPRAIVGTGLMRNYNMYGGETLPVQKRLENIASAWDIPIKIIGSWAR